MISSYGAPLLPYEVIDENNTVVIKTPKNQLTQGSLQVAHLEDKPYVEWSEEDHSNAYHSLQKTVAVWKEKGIADQYMIYGKQEPFDKPFNWEVVPYQKTSSLVSRIWQQFLVLWRITFGGIATTQAQQKQNIDLFENFSSTLEKINAFVHSNCPFCKSEVIDKQLVLAGRNVNVLFNYAPIGFGGEKLHFLIVPKEHKSQFSELTEEEYVEASTLSQHLIRHFNNNRSIEDVYLFHKTGADAGQTVPHWHQHLILTTSKTQDVFGKLTVLKNMLLGSTPMKDQELKLRVQSLKIELEK